MNESRSPSKCQRPPSLLRKGPHQFFPWQMRLRDDALRSLSDYSRAGISSCQLTLSRIEYPVLGYNVEPVRRCWPSRESGVLAYHHQSSCTRYKMSKVSCPASPSSVTTSLALPWHSVLRRSRGALPQDVRMRRAETSCRVRVRPLLPRRKLRAGPLVRIHTFLCVHQHKCPASDERERFNPGLKPSPATLWTV